MSRHRPTLRRQKLAVLYRLQGHPINNIAAALGVSRRTILKYCRVGFHLPKRGERARFQAFKFNLQQLGIPDSTLREIGAEERPHCWVGKTLSAAGGTMSRLACGSIYHAIF